MYTRRETEGGTRTKGGKTERRGRREWTPVTLHANLTRPGCTTTATGGKKGERDRVRREMVVARTAIYGPSSRDDVTLIHVALTSRDVFITA